MPTSDTFATRDGRRPTRQVLGDGPPVVLVHGTGTGRSAFAEVLPALAPAWQAVSYDRAGCGESAAAAHAPAGRGDARHGADLVDLLGTLPSPAVVVGWSSGGTIAPHAALEAPARVRHVVRFDPPFPEPGFSRWTRPTTCFPSRPRRPWRASWTTPFAEPRKPPPGRPRGFLAGGPTFDHGTLFRNGLSSASSGVVHSAARGRRAISCVGATGFEVTG